MLACYGEIIVLAVRTSLPTHYHRHEFLGSLLGSLLKLLEIFLAFEVLLIALQVCLCTNPVWLVKTRLQLQTPQQVRPYSGFHGTPDPMLTFHDVVLFYIMTYTYLFTAVFILFICVFFLLWPRALFEIVS